MFSNGDLFGFVVVFSVSFLICAILVATRSWHLHRSARSEDCRAVQRAHSYPTPRVGGIGVVLAVAVAIFIMPDNLRVRSMPFLPSLAVIFIAGLAEDLGYRISPLGRLLAAALASALAVITFQIWIPRVNLPGIDGLFAFAPIAIGFTIFATAGIANAFNLIDGINGFAAATGVVSALGLSAIATLAGHPMLAQISFWLVPALLGFLVFNYPFGKIFLGDAGAYSIGHILAWIAVALLVRAPDVAAQAVLLVFFWPVADTFWAIYRRRRAGQGTVLPDRLHYHQLMMRGLEIMVIGRGKRHIANPLATLILMPLITAPIMVGVWLWDEPLAASFALLGFAILFIASYLIGMRFVTSGRKLPPPYKRGEPKDAPLFPMAGE